jgi:hypothetical protein
MSDIAVFKTAGEKQILDLIENLQEANKVEIKRSTGMTHEQIIPMAVNYSNETYYATVDGSVACIFGIVVKKKGACVWCMGTDVLKTIPTFFMKRSKKIVKEWVSIHKILYNYIDAENTETFKWLQWLGASFSRVKYGIDGDDFIYFELKEE